MPRNRRKTQTGSIPFGVGFPGTNLVFPRLHPAISHINASSEALSDPQFINIVNKLAENICKIRKDDFRMTFE